MSNWQIKFQNNKKEIIIKCQRNELMKDIISRYGTKSLLKIDEFGFLYNETKINMDQTFIKLMKKINKFKL